MAAVKSTDRPASVCGMIRHKQQVPNGQGERRPCIDHGGTADRLCPEGSDIDLLRYGEGVVDLNAEVAHRAFYPCVAKEQLDRPEISRSAID